MFGSQCVSSSIGTGNASNASWDHECLVAYITASPLDNRGSIVPIPARVPATNLAVDILIVDIRHDLATQELHKKASDTEPYQEQSKWRDGEKSSFSESY